MSSAASKIQQDEFNVSIPGYTLVKKLGEGSFSNVYLATKNGKNFALKVVKSSDSEMSLTFRREAASLARLASNHVVKILEVGDVEGRAYLAMEFVEGDKLSDLVENKSTVPLERASKIIRILAETLFDVHKLGLRHGDLKPENIILRKNGEPVLIDFGLVGEISSQNDNDAQTVGGTLLYSSPEQLGTLGTVPDGRADLYSLGCVYYQLLSGTPPFDSQNPAEIIQMHTRNPVPSLHEVRPEIPIAVDEILRKILAKDPDDRYQTGIGLAKDLDQIDRLDTLLRTGAKDVIGKADVRIDYSVAPFVGREQEISVIKAALNPEGSAEEAAQIFVVLGESGSGKSRLVLEALRDHGFDKLGLFKGKCQESDSVPLAILRESIDYFLRESREANSLSTLIDYLKIQNKEELSYLCSLSKILHENLKIQVESTQTDHGDDEASKFFSAIVGLFRSIHRSLEKELVIYIDDLQWIDNSSFEIVNQLVKSEDIGVTVIFTSRDTKAGQDRINLLQEKFEEGQVKVMALAPLSSQDTLTYLKKVLGEQYGYDAELIEKINSVSNGNPFMMGEVVRSLISQGLLLFAESSWKLTPGVGSSFQFSTNAVNLVLERLKDFETEFIEIFAALSLDGNRFSNRLIEFLTGDEKKAKNRIDLALKHSLIERDSSNNFSFFHDKIREAFDSTLVAEKKATLHQRLFDFYQKQGSLSDVDKVKRGHHFSSSPLERTSELAFQVFHNAGLAAINLYAYEDAISYLRLARDSWLSLGKEEGEIIDTLALIGKCYTIVNKPKEALMVLYRAKGFAKTREESAKIAINIIYVYTSIGECYDALREIEMALDTLGFPLPKSKLGKIFSLVWNGFAAFVMDKTGLGFGSIKNPEHRLRREVLCTVYQQSLAPACYADPFTYLECAVRLYSVSIGLGDHYFYHLGKAAASNLLGQIFGYRKSTELMTKVFEQLASMSDRNVYYVQRVGYSNNIYTFGRKDLVYANWDQHYKGFRAHSDDTLFSNFVQFYFLLRIESGEISELVEAVDVEKIMDMQRMNPVVKGCCTGGLYVALVALDDKIRAVEMRRSLDQTRELSAKSSYIFGGLLVYYLAAAFFERRFDSEVVAWESEFINGILKTYNDQPSNRTALYFAGYIHVFNSSLPGTDKKYHLQRLKELLSFYKYRATIQPQHRIHYFILKAAESRLSGHLERARNWLFHAESLLGQVDSKLVELEYHLEAARHFAANRNFALARPSFQSAFEIANERRWVGISNGLEREFPEFYKVAAEDLATRSGGGEQIAGRTVARTNARTVQRTNVRPGVTGATQQGLASSTQMGRFSDMFGFHSERYLDSLLKVSVALTGGAELVQKYVSVLDVTLELFNADRALLFFWEDGKADVVFEVGRNSKKESLSSETLYSKSILKKCWESDKGLVFTGTESGEISTSASIVAGNLRSAMAVPFHVGKRKTGILYIDSSLSKGLFNDQDMGIFQVISDHIGIMVELVKLAQAEAEKAQLSKRLEIQTQIASANRKVKIMVDNIRQSMFAADQDGLILEPVSTYSQKIFGIDVVGKSVFDIVYGEYSKVDIEQISQIKTAFVTAFGEDELQWDLSSDVLPKRLEFQNEEQQKVLRLNNSPIWDDEGKLQQILYVVEDISDLERSEQLAKQEAEKNVLLSEMANSDRKELITFFENLKSRCEWLNSSSVLSKDVSAERRIEILRELHTLKGNARMFGLKGLSTCIHEIETNLQTLSLEEFGTQLILEMVIFNAALQKYTDGYEKFFAPDANEEMESISRGVLTVLKNLGGKSGAKADEFKYWIQRLSYLSLKSSLNKYRLMSNEIAAEQRKQVQVVYEGEDLLLSPEMLNYLEQCFIHLFRNCVDHGLEPQEDRIQNGKKPEGTIKVIGEQSGSKLKIALSDDGKGIESEVIAKKLVEKGLVTESELEKLTEKEIIHYIFHPGFSTKDQQSEVSGRGVGMDVVKSTIEHLGGSIEVRTKVGQGTTFLIEVPEVSKI